MNVDNLENGKNDEKNVQTTATDQHAQRERLKMRDMKIRDGQKCRGGKCEI